MFDSRRGAWATFQFLVRRRLLEQGVELRSDGSLEPERRLRRASDRARRREAGVALARAPRTAGSGSSST